MTEQPTVAGGEASSPDRDADLVLGSLLLMVVTALLVAALDTELKKDAQDPPGAPPAVTPTPAMAPATSFADGVAASRWRRFGARLARRLRAAPA